MATVTVYSSTRIDDLIKSGVVGATITNGNLILQLRDGSTINVGAVGGNVADASTVVKGLVELATDTEVADGVDSTRAVTPLALAGLTGNQSRNGLVRYGTSAEVAAGTSFSRAVAPATLAPLLSGLVSKNVSKTTVDVADPDEGQMTIAGVLRSWWNEWRALRGRNPYSTWADSLVRAIVENGDNTSGNALEIEDRRTSNTISVIWGVNWGTGRVTQQDCAVGMVYVLNAGQTSANIPAALPAGTLVVRKTA